ncbi:peroxiredoxin Q [Roridomyces roridus]|uniref:thioredoxin-dependent peroxiredoxin n=1 Tax=Roridomyces roridus TaxID=1738132 RepID=A0AAD7CAW1_9AGAR|nr:peroxiredoxin Q [Roridomyces roridus]
MSRTLIGKDAPAFTLTNYDGQPFTVTPGANGIPIVLFFYPKAGTYGCTKEACQFRDCHCCSKGLRRKNKLTYPVLSDSEGKAREAYKLGKSFFGLGGTARTTIIIDGKGVVRDTFESTMQFSKHAKFATSTLAQLEAEAAAPAPAETAPAAPCSRRNGTCRRCPRCGG